MTPSQIRAALEKAAREYADNMEVPEANKYWIFRDYKAGATALLPIVEEFMSKLEEIQTFGTRSHVDFGNLINVQGVMAGEALAKGSQLLAELRKGSE